MYFFECSFDICSLFVDSRVLNKGVYLRFSFDVNCLKNKATADKTNFHVPIYPGPP